MNQESREIASAAAPGRHYTMVTVVGIEGSSYRRPGARMLIDDEGRRTGSVSGGCLEQDLVQRAGWLAREGPRLLRVSTDADPDETDLSYPGCGGTLELLLESFVVEHGGGDPVSLLQWIHERREAAVLATVLEGSDRIPVGRRFALTSSGHRLGADGASLWSAAGHRAQHVLRTQRSTRERIAVEGDECELSFEYIRPTRELLVCGRHHDVQPLVTMARMQGWSVTVAAGRTPAAQLGRPEAIITPSPADVGAWVRARPDAAVVLMTHSLALDRQLLGALLVEPAPAYLGLLGPHHRARDIFEQLEREGVCRRSVADARVRAPIGLDLGGDGPAAVALSIVADIQAVWAGRSARPLVQTEQRAIHARPMEQDVIALDRGSAAEHRPVAELAG